MHKLLIIGPDIPTLQRIVPILNRADFEATHLMHSDEAIAAVARMSYSLIIARYPLVGPPLADLVKAVRSDGSHNRDAGFLLVAEPSAVEDVGKFLGRGINRIVSLDSTADRFLDAIADLLDIAPRRNLRAMLQLELWVDLGSRRLLTVTENISCSGMLVRGGREIPIGSRLQFELRLPGDLAPVRGEVEVARYTDLVVEKVVGFGAKILSFHGVDRDRLHSFLKKE